MSAHEEEKGHSGLSSCFMTWVVMRRAPQDKAQRGQLPPDLSLLICGDGKTLEASEIRRLWLTLQKRNL